MSLSLHNYAGDEGDTKCPHCVDLNRLPVLHPHNYQIGLFLTIAWGVTTAVLMTKGFPWHALAVMLLGPMAIPFLVPALTRKVVYPHYRGDGRLHIHQHNPLKEAGIPWIPWRKFGEHYAPQNHQSVSDYVNGVVIKLVFHRGWGALLAKWNRSTIFDNVTERQWRIVSVSDLANVTLSDGIIPKNKCGTMMVDEVLAIVNRYPHLESYLSATRRLHRFILPTFLAVMDFLAGDKTSKPSRGMGQARGLMQAGFNLAFGDDVPCLAAASERQAMLARLQAQVAEASEVAEHLRKTNG